MVELVDSGGMGSVYRALDVEQGGEPVALKVIKRRGPAAPRGDDDRTRGLSGQSTSAPVDTQQLLDSFQHESELLADLRHPSIVKHVSHGQTAAGDPYLAMEWVEGEDLKARLEREPLSVEQTVRLGLRLTEGLAAAHRVGVVHRDIKPSNIMLPSGNVSQAKIADFGIAQFTQYVVVPGGTPGYMAPELHLDTGHIDARADVYSLGLLLTRCLSRADNREGLPGTEDLQTATIVEASAVGVDGTTLGLDAPADLDELLRRMLSTDRALRPAHGGVVSSALQAISAGLAFDGSSVVSARERQLVGVIRVQLDDQAPPAREAIAAVLDKFDATSRALYAKTIIVVLGSRVSEGDQNLRSALCALELRRVCPQADVVLVLGQVPPHTERSLVAMTKELLEAAGPRPYDEPGERPVLIDPQSANLFDVRFEVERGDAVSRLLRERRELAASRLLLGRPSPWVGRAAEFDRMLLVYLDAIAAREPRTVLLQAEAGMGKSRIAQEFLGALETTATPPQVWIARGDPVSAGSPFSLLGQVIRSMAGIVDGESEDRRRDKLHRRLAEYFVGPELAQVESFLGELCGAPFPSEHCLKLLVARQDPKFMAEQTRQAWAALVTAASGRRPVVLVLDDCQWGDLATLRYCDHVMRSSASHSMVLVAMVRPGASPWATVGAASQFTRIQLLGLSRDSSLEFLHDVLGADLDPRLAERLVERAAGNPLYLEELARAIGQRGSEDLGDTIAAMMHSRLQSLGFDARQILRAASVFGQVFWLDGVVALRQRGSARALVREWLDELVELELVVHRPVSRFLGDEEYEFHHQSVRDAAYGMLTEQDTLAAHRSVASWLRAHGERDAYVLAEHSRHGGESAQAARYYVEAARKAFARQEFDAVTEMTERGLADAPEPEPRGELELLRAEVESIAGRHAEAVRYSLLAMEDLPSTSASWLAAAGEASLASARVGDHERVREIVARIDQIDATATGGGVELTGLIRAALPLAAAGDTEIALKLLDSVERATDSISRSNPAARGPYHSARALKGLCTGALDRSLSELQAATREFEEAGSLRNAWEHQAGAGFMCLELGMIDEADVLLMGIIGATEGVGLPHLNAVAKHNLGRRIAENGSPHEGRVHEEQALRAFEEHDNTRMQGLTHAFLARIALVEGDLPQAEEHARQGVRLLEHESGSKIVALATLAQVLVEVGKPEEALQFGQRAYDQLRKLELATEGESLARLAHAEALWASGRTEGARRAIAEAHDNLLARASKIESESARDSFLRRVPENAAIVRLAQQWAEASE